MDLAEKIKKIRELKRISQAEVARILGLDPAAYFRLEKRGIKLSIEQVSAIAEAIGTTATNLLSDEKQESLQDSEEIAKLKSRINELEDRLRDKQFILDSIDARIYKARYDLYGAICVGSMEFYLNSTENPEPIYEEEIAKISGFMGEESFNKEGKRVLLIGFGKVLALTATDLYQIYDYMHRTNPDHFTLLLAFEPLLRFPLQSLVHRTFDTFLISQMPKEQREQLFRDGYRPDIHDLFK